MTCIEPLSPSLFMGEGFGVGVNQVFQQSPLGRVDTDRQSSIMK